MAETRKIKAGQSVLPSVFVALDASSAGGTVSPAASVSKMFGISQANTKNAPYPLLDDGYAGLGTDTLNANFQDFILVYTFPDKEVYLYIDTGGCNPGDALTPGTGNTGYGLVTTTTGDWVGAVAKQSAIAADLGVVDLDQPYKY